LRAVTKLRLVKTVDREDLAGAVVNCRVSEFAMALWLLVVTVL
jgi:hypothetical protein